MTSMNDHIAAVGVLMDWIEERSGCDALTIVGHRIDKYGEDLPEIRDWKWSNPKAILRTRKGN